jgi:hypothetical protein
LKFSLTSGVEYFYDVVLLVVLIIGIVRYKKLSTPFKVLALSAVSTFLLNVAERISVIKSGTNAPVLHIEALADYVFYSSIYYFLFTNKLLKAAIIVSIIPVSIFAIINALIFQPFLKVFPTNVSLPTLATLTVLSLLLFRQMLLSPLKTPLLNQGVFWYNTAILFYSTTQFLINGLSNYFLMFHRHVFDEYWFCLWYAIFYTFAALTALALLKASKENNKKILVNELLN